MTTPDDNDSHDPWEALAVGYALMALTDDDERVFKQHLAGCPYCAHTVATSTSVMGEMAYAAGPAQPPESLRAAIVRAVAAEDAGTQASPAREALPGQATPHTGSKRLRRWRAPTWAAWTTAAACLALAVGAFVGAAVQHSAHESDRAQLNRLEPALSCLRSPSCQAVHLSASDSAGTHPVTVLVEAEHAWLLVNGLPENDPATTTYVLWQKANGDVRAVHTFDVSHRGLTVIDAGQIDAPLSATDFFAVSREAGRTAPPQPSPPVAVGVLHG